MFGPYSDMTSYDWYQTYGNLNHLLSADILTKPLSTNNKLQDRSIEELDHFDKKVPFFPSREECRVLILGCGKLRILYIINKMILKLLIFNPV
ncbi:MAG: hypothetical protein ACI8RD_009245 [Bacillariaceae sp.]|jgi:hypothetical protein